jgi:hypothetical protein
MSKGILEPNSDLHDIPARIRDKMHVNLLPKGNIGDTDLVIEE